MLQQYQQQPDYTTPYGGVSGIGYSAQPDAGYFNYSAAAAESSWYGSPSPAADVVVSCLTASVLGGELGPRTSIFFFVNFTRVIIETLRRFWRCEV